MKKRIKILDNNFSHEKYSSCYQESEFIEWDRNFSEIGNDLCFITDSYLFNKIDNNNLVGWILEPKSISPEIYKMIESDNKIFEKILTYDKHLLETNKKFIFYPHGGCWIKKEDQKIYEKNKLVSMIYSNKRGTDGQNLRHEIASLFSDKIDMFGRGHREISYKLDGLSNYKYSIVVENTKYDYYFTEKLIDCFVTGTIPIYWGCPSISNFFDTNGMIQFDSIVDLKKILSEISDEDYERRMESIKHNFIESKKYLISEDWIYKNTNILQK